MLNRWPALWILLAGPLWGLPGPDRVPPRGPFSPAPPCCSAAAGREAAHPGTTLLKEKRIDGKLVRQHTHLADGPVVGTYELGMFLSPARALAATCGLELPDPLGGAARGGRGRIKSASAALQRFRVSVAAASRQIGEDMWAFARCKVQRGFPAGTPVRTERGLVPVEEVRKGEKVHSWDPATGEWRLAEVEATMSREYHGDIITVTVTNEDGEAEDTFRATANHPVFVAEGRNLRLRPQPAEVPASEAASEAGRWVSAGDLRIGDTLLTERHSRVPITELTRERRRIPVYNLHVRGTHTYAIGRSGALVHNSCAPGTGGNQWDAIEDAFIAPGKGVNSPKVRQSQSVGNQAHADLAEKVKKKPGWQSEPELIDPLTGSTVKPDAVTPSGHPLEFKPNTPSGRKKGNSQLKKYERATGKKGRTIYYDPY